ncbi:FKBP-type peptidyl-prolyl cis-trans isomerase [Flavihumibacter sp.]|jgi:FKBP-type peptidyl-prolyl cis-trans isomerase FkpA|uniref:FKBP-type peptidyl-prolyl cis-trans isomerase n=1 Tax=Flavihumibacter sp. TaxID=1913981 RepID=UPI002FC8C1D3
MVKKIGFVFLVMMVVLGTWHCSKSDTSCNPVPPQNEESAILQYIATNNITAVKDPSGLYYQVIEEGSGSAPTVNSRIAVTYSGYLTNGNKFDEMTSPIQDPTKWWPLGGLIQGWQIGIPKIKKGGKIKMILPSALAYGCTGAGSIPANSILVFDVTLVDFN